MDKRTYKAARRAIIVTGLKEIADGLYGLNMQANEDADFAAMFEEPTFDVELEGEDEN